MKKKRRKPRRRGGRKGGEGMATKSLDIIIKAHDRASKEFKQLRRDLDALNQAGSNMQDLGAGFLAFGASLSAGLGMAIKSAADLETAVAKVASVMERSAGDWADITEVAREFGRTTTHSAVESAEALQVVAQYGYKLADAQKIVATTLKLSTAQQYDLAHTTDIVISTFKNFEKQGYSVAKIADILSQSSNISSASMDKFRYSLKYTAPVANALGITLEDMVAQLSLLYDAGLPAETAGTSLRMAYQRLLDPTKKAENALKSYGIALKDVNPETRKMADIIDTLNKAGVSTNDIFTIFGVETAPAMLAMMDRGGDALRNYEKQLKSAGGSMEKMYKVQMSTLNSQLAILKNNFTDLGISLGMTLLPSIKRLVAFTQKLVNSLNGMSEGTRQVLAYSLVAGAGLSLLAGFVLYAGGAFLIAVASVKEFVALMKGVAKVVKNWKWVQTLGQWLGKLRTAFSGFGQIMAPVFNWVSKIPVIGWILVGVIALLSSFYLAWKNNWLGVRDTLSSVWQWIVGVWDQIVQSCSEFVSGIMDWISQLDIMGSLQSAWAGIVEWVSSVWQSIKTTIYNFLLGILMDTGQTQQEAVQTLKDAWNNIVAFFTGIGNILKFLFYDMWVNIGNTIMSTLAWIWDLIVSVWTAISTWLSSFISSTVATLSSLWSQFASMFMGLMSPLMPYIQTVWNFIVNIFTWAWTLIKSIVSAGISFVSSIISGGFNAVMAIIKGIWNTIVTIIQGAWSIIKSVVSAGIEIVKNVIALGINIVNIARTIWSTIRSVVNSGLQTVIGIFRSFAGTARQAGSALMEAFASGIKSAVGKVTSAVSSVVKSARAYFGFSDAKKGAFSNITYSGFATMSAFAKGATQARSMLAQKIGGTLSSALSGGVTGGLGINLVGGQGLASAPAPEQQPTVNVTVNISGADDPKRIADVVIETIQRELRR
jgi:TP901 family phage tail tape measure protein